MTKQAPPEGRESVGAQAPREGLLLRLSPDAAGFEIVLPSGVSVRVSPDPLAPTLRRLLLAQKAAILQEDEERERAAASGKTLAQVEHWRRFGVSTPPSPTEQRLRHEAQHKTPHDKCVFCIAEGHTPKAPRVASKTRRNIGGGASVLIPKRELSLEDLL